MNVVEAYIKIKYKAVSGESLISARLVGQDSGKKQYEGEGEDGGRRQERAKEGKGPIYHFARGREKHRPSSISTNLSFQS